MKRIQCAALAAVMLISGLLSGCALTTDLRADLTGARTPVIAAFEGDCRLLRGGAGEEISTETVLAAGDVLSTGPDAYMFLSLGSEKKLFLEPSSQIAFDELSTSDDKKTVVTITQGKVWGWVRETLRSERYLVIRAEDLMFEVAEGLFSVEPTPEVLIVDCVEGQVPVFQGKGSYLDILEAGGRHGFYPMDEYSGGVGWEQAALDGPISVHPMLASFISLPADTPTVQGDRVTADAPPARISGPLADAYLVMTRLESVESVATTEVSMQMSGMSVTSTTVTRTSEFYNPLRQKTEVEMSTMGTTTKAESYTVQDGTEFTTYYNDGSGWQTSSVSFSGLGTFYAANDQQSAISCLSGGAELTVTGNEEVNGIRCVRIDGVITGDALTGAMAGLSSAADLGESGAALASISGIPVSYWLDAENHWLVRMEMDMTQAMTEMVGSMGGAQGMKITSARAVTEYSAFNNAAAFTLPQ